MMGEDAGGGHGKGRFLPEEPLVFGSAADLKTTIELVSAFAWLIDHRRYDLVHELVAEDMVYANPGGEVVGWTALRAGVAALSFYERTQHVIANHLGAWAGDDFHGSTYCVAAHLYRDQEGMLRKYDMGIQYREHIVRDGGRLRMKRRFVDTVWQQDGVVATQAPAEFREAIAAVMTRPAQRG